jgi:2-polyprenyl-6-methoxyphenol hydroxylase-like FAD-dependent oxidoreductase
MYDAIIVGARCAGAATGMLLARDGKKVLMIDRDAAGTDMPMSTHMIWHGGVKKLADWGLIERLEATGCKPMRTLDLDLGEFHLVGHAPSAGDVDMAYGPKREVLDKLLVEAAMEAGAEYRPNVTVTDLIHENDCVVGVRFEDAAGNKGEERAKIVVGADGRNSRVAKLVGAQESNVHANAQGTYFAYFADLPLKDMEFVSRPGRMFYSWATNDGHTMAGMCCKYEDFQKQNKDPETHFYRELEEFAPDMCARVRAATRVGDWRSGSTRGFSRKPHGPGWALVGDAGVTVDPISAAGISLAFKDADLLAHAISAGLDGKQPMAEALQAFEDERDTVSLPMLGFSYEMGKLEEPPQEMIDLFVSMYGNPQAIADYFGVFAQTVPVGAFFDPENMARIISEARAA